MATLRCGGTQLGCPCDCPVGFSASPARLTWHLDNTFCLVTAVLSEEPIQARLRADCTMQGTNQKSRLLPLQRAVTDLPVPHGLGHSVCHKAVTHNQLGRDHLCCNIAAEVPGTYGPAQGGPCISNPWPAQHASEQSIAARASFSVHCLDGVGGADMCQAIFEEKSTHWVPPIFRGHPPSRFREGLAGDEPLPQQERRAAALKRARSCIADEPQACVFGDILGDASICVPRRQRSAMSWSDRTSTGATGHGSGSPEGVEGSGRDLHQVERVTSAADECAVAGLLSLRAGCV
jgi:hypothetical protein